MIYGNNQTRTLIDDDAHVARIIVENVLVYKLTRAKGGTWQLAGLKIATATEPAYNPTWKTKNEVERLPDFTEGDEARVFDEAAVAARDALELLGVVTLGGGDHAG
jgi:hypothetical protein